MTSSLSTNPATDHLAVPGRASFLLFAGAVGAALAVVLTLVACNAAGAEAGSAVAIGLFAAVMGLMIGIAAAGWLHENSPARAEGLAPAVYLLGALAVPFLFCTAVLGLFVAAIDSYQF